MRRNCDYYEWHLLVDGILNSEEFIKRKTFKHHGDESVYDHSIRVSKLAYRMAKALNINYKNVAIAGLLHDLYTTPWQDKKERVPIHKMHGFTHARDALENSRKYFNEYLNDEIENSILRHMFPLNITPPKYLGGYIITIADKIVSLNLLVSLKSMSKIFVAPILGAVYRSKEVLILCYLYVSYFYVL